RTQQIIHLEARAGEVADPLGGSWYVESLTDELETRIDEQVRQIEARGDVADLVDSGFFRAIFHSGMDRHSRQVHSGELAVVGVNCHTIPPAQDRLLRDEAEERFPADHAHVERIRAWRATRDNDALAQRLAAVSAATAGGDDLMGPIRSALAAEASIGEITGALRVGVGHPADPFAGASSPGRS
ncbi:MAG: methylmalonyl-CoA mutase family protein, partial [Acidimicrobiales bacterium]|nr:methylmalonyl-CoA mutase family protein [Acidimicrobiales bacterium]